MEATPETLRGLTAADVMLVTPKTLPAETSVAGAREQLADEHVQMLLLTDGDVFRGAITSIPDDADGSAPALDYADEDAETMAPTEPAVDAFERTRRNPHRRVIVLDANGDLAGLVCLNTTLTHFCAGRGRSALGET